MPAMFFKAIGNAIGIAVLMLALAGGAGGAPYTVGGITVDASGESAQVAQARALANGQRLALAAMYRKLTLESEHGRLPKADAAAVERLVRSYEVVRERRSPQRYIAELRVHFDPDGVRAALRDAGIPYAETESLPRLVVPIYEDAAGLRLWAPPNPWREAWQALNWRDHLVDLVLPFGDLDDMTAITAEQARDGDGVALAAFGARYDAPQTLVTLARQASDGSVAVTATLHLGEDSEVVFDHRLAAGDPDAVLLQAALGLAESLEAAWKRNNVIDFRVSGTMVVTATFSGLENWLDIRRRLEGTSQVEEARLVELRTAEARLELRHYGAAAALVQALGGRGLTLAEDGPGRWRIETSGMASIEEPPAVPDAAAAEPAATRAPAIAPAPADDLLFE